MKGSDGSSDCPILMVLSSKLCLAEFLGEADVVPKLNASGVIRDLKSRIDPDPLPVGVERLLLCSGESKFALSDDLWLTAFETGCNLGMLSGRAELITW